MVYIWLYFSTVLFFCTVLLPVSGDADAWRTSGSRVESIESITEDSALKQQLEIPLTCHVCHSELQPECEYIDDEEDYGFPEQCSPGFNLCQVKRISYTSVNENGTSSMKVIGVKRVCSTKCSTGCLIMGDRVKLHVCSSCCSQRLCNIGNSGSGLIPGRRGPFWRSPEPWAMLIVVSLLLLVQTQKIALYFAKWERLDFDGSSTTINNMTDK